MQPCVCYILKYQKCTNLTDKINIDCIRKQFNSTNIIGYKGDGETFYDCPNCCKCHEQLGLIYRKYKSSNCVVNTYSDGRIEMIIYNKPFQVIEEHANLQGNKQGRNYRKIISEDYGIMLIPKSESIRDQQLYTSLSKCSTRAQDNYYGKALSNKWKYFATFTVSPEICNRYDDKEVKDLWGLFRQRLVKKYPNCKYLCVPERHDNGALHFHCLLWTSQDIPLKPYIGKQGKQYSKTGAELYTFDLWDYGICTLAIIPPEDNQCKVINYLIAYTTKQSNLGWGQRRFFATRNLLDKSKSNFMQEDTDDIEDMYELDFYKKKDNCTIYRNFNVKEAKE